MKSLAHTLLQKYYGLIVVLLIYMDAEISIILCQGFSEKNNFYLLSYHMRQIFYELYRDWILGRYK